MSDVVLAGEYYLDLVFTGLAEAPRLGAEVMAGGVAFTPGAAFTTAAALTRLGVDVGWWCETGSDEFSARLRAEIAAAGIPDRLVQTRAHPVIRVTAAFSTAADRAFVSRFEGAETLPPPDALTGARLLIVNGLTCADGLPALFTAARAMGVACWLDPQARPVPEALWPLLDVLLPNADEAAALAGIADAHATRVTAAGFEVAAGLAVVMLALQALRLT